MLGHNVTPEGLLPSGGQVSAIRNLVDPGCGDELIHFLYLVNFFARFIDHFAQTERQLYDVQRGVGIVRI